MTRNKGHGRIEVRKLQTSTKLNDYVTFPYVAQVGRVHRITYNLQGEWMREETAYLVTSLSVERADSARLLTLNRGHWSIENRLHWVRDVTFDEDRSQIRTQEGPRVMATLRNLAISLFRLNHQSNVAQAIRRCARKPERALELIGA